MMQTCKSSETQQPQSQSLNYSLNYLTRILPVDHESLCLASRGWVVNNCWFSKSATRCPEMETWGHEITPFCMTNTSKGSVVCFIVCPSSQNQEQDLSRGKGGEEGVLFLLDGHEVRKSSGPHYCPKTTSYYVLH